VTALLEVEGLRAGYGGSAVLHGVDLTVGEGRAVALLGRNGAGRSTLLSAIMGLLRPSAGSVRLQGRELAGRPANLVARSGVAWSPRAAGSWPTSPSSRTSGSPPAAAALASRLLGVN
jgi:ABC-type branched-subunit amino acid transport system ATPase component